MQENEYDCLPTAGFGSKNSELSNQESEGFVYLLEQEGEVFDQIITCESRRDHLSFSTKNRRTCPKQRNE